MNTAGRVSPDDALPGRRGAAWLARIAVAGLCACSSGGGSDRVATVAFAPVAAPNTLQASDYDGVIAAAANSIDAPSVAIAVVDRIGNILRVWNRNPGSQAGDSDNALAVSIARTAAFLSHSQAPLTSRTEQFISTFHFPAVFQHDRFDDPQSPFGGGPARTTLGVRNTPQGPLWQIQNTNRGSLWTDPSIFVDPSSALPRLTNPDGSVPSPGLTPLPGGIPLYKRVAPAGTPPPAGFEQLVTKRLVGALGVYVTTAGPGTTPRPEVAEYAALQGSLATDPSSAETYGIIPPVPSRGGVYLVGVLLPAVEQTTLPAGVLPDPTAYASGANVALPAIPTEGGAGIVDPPVGQPAGSLGAFLIGPLPTPGGELTASDIDTIAQETARAALDTHAAIRLPAKSPCAMSIAITDRDGGILGLFRMTDGTLFSIEIAVTKARETVYFSRGDSVDQDGPRAGFHPLDGIVPPGTAVTARTLGFLTQPFFPPGIDGTLPGPLFDLVIQNADPANFQRMGFAPPSPQQSGLVLFPGSAPLYMNGTLVGAIGVSGDGVEQDDFVTSLGIRRAEIALAQAHGVPTFELEPPPADRADAYSYMGVRLPYFKFPQHPGG